MALSNDDFNMRSDASSLLRFVAAAYAANVSLIITNSCDDTIWPAIATQNGEGPERTGFEILAGSTQNLTVGTSWNGRVWARTNCTFDTSGIGSCSTGDCGGNITCTGIVRLSSSMYEPC